MDDRASGANSSRFMARLPYRLAKKKGFDREEAEEIVQRVCVQMARWLPKFRYDPQRGGFRKAVLTFALNEIRQYQRREIRDKIKQRNYVDHVIHGGRPTCAPPPDADENGTEAWWNSAETMRLVQLACDELQREVKSRD